MASKRRCLKDYSETSNNFSKKLKNSPINNFTLKWFPTANISRIIHKLLIIILKTTNNNRQKAVT